MSRTLIALAVAVTIGGQTAGAQPPPASPAPVPVVVAPSSEPQYVSPAGERYFAEPDARGFVAAAQARAAEGPRRADTLARLGDALAALLDSRAAIDAYTQAIALEPEEPSLFQRRGHRHLSLREFDQAAADLERALKLDPEMGNTWFYLGVTRYVTGRFDSAAECFDRAVAANRQAPAAALPALDWLYLAYLRAGMDAKASAVLDRIGPDTVGEGAVRFSLQRLLFYKGLRTQDEVMAAGHDDTERATLAYGIAAFDLAHGRTDEARRRFREVVATSAWPTLAFIAAEQDLARLP
jgi:tetratricopeptide (TPR) repeat protein